MAWVFHLKRQVDQELESTKIQKHQFRGSESPDDSNLPYSGKDSKTNRDTFLNKTGAILVETTEIGFTLLTGR